MTDVMREEYKTEVALNLSDGAIFIECWGTKPVPQGSKSATVRGGKAVMYEANKALPAWREMIAGLAKQAMIARAGKWEQGAVGMQTVYFFKRPKKHYLTKGLRLDAPHLHDHYPDLDKLDRAIGDALTGIVYKDDGQVAVRRSSKEWNEQHGVRINVYPL